MDISRFPARLAHLFNTGDWQAWTSEFAAWDVLMLDYADRGVLSGNDRVVIESLPSLTRNI